MFGSLSHPTGRNANTSEEVKEKSEYEFGIVVFDDLLKFKQKAIEAIFCN